MLHAQNHIRFTQHLKRPTNRAGMMEIEKLLREPHHLRAGMNSCTTMEKSYGLRIKKAIKSLPFYLKNFHNSSAKIGKVLRTQDQKTYQTIVELLNHFLFIVFLFIPHCPSMPHITHPLAKTRNHIISSIVRNACLRYIPIAIKKTKLKWVEDGSTNDGTDPRTN